MKSPISHLIHLMKETILRTLSRITSEKVYLKIMYRYFQNKRLNLKYPETLTEKIQWKKIYDKNPLYPICANKYAVRDYVKEKTGEKYLVPLLFHTDKPEEIPFDNLPLPFIIKSNHGNCHIIIIRNKRDIKKKKIVRKCKRWLRYSHYWIGREWQYKNIKPKIIIEKLMLDENEKIPNDYKFYCFNGKVEFIQVDVDRLGDHKCSYFTHDWKLCPFNSVHESVKRELGKNFAKPRNLREIIKVAEKLSKGFDFVRVDLYSIKNKIYFGELTFSPGSGFVPFTVRKYDLAYGKKLKLSPRLYFQDSSGNHFNQECNQQQKHWDKNKIKNTNFAKILSNI